MDLQKIWAFALYFVNNCGQADGYLQWVKNLPDPSEVSDQTFYSELTWCIYNAGMKERVIRAKWPQIQAAFHNFDPDEVVSDPFVLETVLKVFGNKGKAAAVITSASKIIKDRPIALRVSSMDLDRVLDYLQEYPRIGPVLKYHLARNIGFSVCKPDRHLVRLAKFCGYESPALLVDEIAGFTGEEVGFVDYVLWQMLALLGDEAYATLEDLS